MADCIKEIKKTFFHEFRFNRKIIFYFHFLDQQRFMDVFCVKPLKCHQNTEGIFIILGGLQSQRNLSHFCIKFWHVVFGLSVKNRRR